MSVQQQFLNYREVAKAVALCHLVAELIGDRNLLHKTGIIKNIFINERFKKVDEKTLNHALEMLIEFVFDENHRKSLEHILEVGKVMEPHDPFLKRFKRFLLIMDGYMARCLAGDELSPDVLDVQEDGILFSKNPLVKLTKTF